jgi:hypothetical protein
MNYDYWVFCWYRGCFPRQVWTSLKNQWLYVLRDLNDTAIVWYTGHKEEMDLAEAAENAASDPLAEPVEALSLEAKKQRWIAMAEAIGKTVAEIVHDLTGFHRIPLSEQL